VVELIARLLAQRLGISQPPALAGTESLSV